MAFIGQEIVRKQQKHNFSWGMYTFIAVFIHFNYFIDLKINFHTNSYNLASVRLLWFWGPCGFTSSICLILYILLSLIHLLLNKDISRPFNPHHMQIWRFWKKVQKNLEIGTSNLEISKICVKLKKNNRLFQLFECFFFTLSVPWLRFRRRIRVILWFFFALEFWTTSSHFEICACVRRLSFPRDLSAPMFHWNWHFTQVFSQISLINSAVMNTDYSIFLHTLRNFLGFSRFTGSPWDLEAKLWDREMASQTVSLTVKPWELEGLY